MLQLMSFFSILCNVFLLFVLFITMVSFDYGPPILDNVVSHLQGFILLFCYMYLFSWWINISASLFEAIVQVWLEVWFRRRLCDSNTRLPLVGVLFYYSPLSQYTNCFRWNVSSRTCFSGYNNRVYQTLTTISLRLCQTWMKFWSKLHYLCQTCYTPSQRMGALLSVTKWHQLNTLHIMKWLDPMSTTRTSMPTPPPPLTKCQVFCDLFIGLITQRPIIGSSL